MLYHRFRKTQLIHRAKLNYRTHTTTLQHTQCPQTYNDCATLAIITYVKDKDDPRDRQGAVYKIKCCDCQATYIGETSRNRNAQITEHKRATKIGDINNNIAEHHSKTKHSVDWDSSKCLTNCTNYYYRHTLESWYTNLEQTT